MISRRIAQEIKQLKMPSIYDLAMRHQWQALSAMLQERSENDPASQEVDLALRTAVNHLAIKGEEEAVLHLIDKYQADINDAMNGAGIGGRWSLIDALLTRNADFIYAIQGAAYVGNLPLVDYMLTVCSLENLTLMRNAAAIEAVAGKQSKVLQAMIKLGASPTEAVKEAARRGFPATVQYLITNGASVWEAIFHAFLAGHFHMVNALTKELAESELDSLVLNINSEVDLTLPPLEVYARINDDELREQLILTSKDPEVKKNEASLIRQSKALNVLMLRHALTFEEAQAWVSPAILFLFLKGTQLYRHTSPVRETIGLPPDVVILIASFVLNMSVNQTASLYSKRRFNFNQSVLVTQLHKASCSKLGLFSLSNADIQALEPACRFAETADDVKKALNEYKRKHPHLEDDANFRKHARHF